ncbi:hypothetical protein [Lysinibacillus fusiformis]|uniref:hypothetical protein n=1 Tax=Lysinibacillus fusiformis TaxID=28031 RepID=UPI001C92E5F1|nr:hypothetical protein [Lysinibacillus fusiformis]
MVKFKDLFSDYGTYSNDTYLMNIVTPNLLREIAQKLPRVLQDYKRNTFGLNLDGAMKNVCDKVSLHTNNDKTGNWSFDYIVKDFDSQVRDFEHIKFHKFMDAMEDLGRMDVFQDALNEIFEDHNFGYRLTGNLEKPWISINPSIGLSIDIDEVIVTTAEICEQTAEHIKQAKQQLTRAVELRPRKDAVRDCLSAMESLMKQVTNTHDIKHADTIIRADAEKWGQVSIAKDGISLWNMFHKDYKDIRHGDFDITKLSHDEAVYFIDKILAYVKYISSRVMDSSREEIEKLPF